MSSHQATNILARYMDKQRGENVRGDAYREYSQERLLRMIEQNFEEFLLAIKYDNDVEDKAGDVANFIGMYLHNRLYPVATEEPCTNCGT